MNAYFKERNGSLTLTGVVELNGDVYTKQGIPLNYTGKRIELKGLTFSVADIFETEFGDVFYVQRAANSLREYYPKYQLVFLIEVRFLPATEKLPERVRVKRRNSSSIYNRCTHETSGLQFATKMDEAHFFAKKLIQEKEFNFDIALGMVYKKVFLFGSVPISRS